MKKDQYINKNNYESWFLLYADNELSEPERQLVLEFVAGNPELKDGLELLLATITKADERISYKRQSELLKDEGLEPVSDEQLILLLDSELNEQETRRIMGDKSEVLQERLAAFKKAYLLPDTAIKYAQKKSLYKTRPLGYWLPRVAAAIILVAAGSWLFFSRDKGVVEERNNQASVLQKAEKGLTKPITDVPLEVTKPPAVALNEAGEKSSVDVQKPIPETKGNLHQSTKSVAVVPHVSEHSMAENSGEVVQSTDSRTIIIPDEKAVSEISGVALALATETALAAVQKEDTSVADPQVSEPETKRRTFLNRVVGQFKERAIATLLDDDEHINVAGLAINIRK